MEKIAGFDLSLTMLQCAKTAGVAGPFLIWRMWTDAIRSTMCCWIFYIDKLEESSALMIAASRRIDRVLSFVTRHRKHTEVPVLPKTDEGCNPAVSLARRLENRQPQDRYFRKVENWEPDWNFWKPF